MSVKLLIYVAIVLFQGLTLISFQLIIFSTYPGLAVKHRSEELEWVMYSNCKCALAKYRRER